MLCVFTKYAWVKPLTDESAKTVLGGFIGVVNEFKRKPNKLWIEQRKELWNNLMHNS